MFDARKFLKDKFGTHLRLIAFLRAFGADAPTEAQAYKWFLRGSIPAEWLPVLLAYLEIDNSAPVSVVPYLERRRER